MQKLDTPERVEIFNARISVVDINMTYQFIINYDFSIPGYICLPNTYMIVKSYKNPVINKILNNAVLTLPDGKPLEFIARVKRTKNIRSVSGYWLMFKLLKTQLTHFYYGATEETLVSMNNKLEIMFPEAKILGYCSPPYLTEDQITLDPQINKDIDSINKLKPDIIWIGISSPKQDILMEYLTHRLNRGLLIGVGAVFNYVAGKHKISPEWMKRLGLRWVYRLYQEPRLWRRYAYGNSMFIYLVIKDLFRSIVCFFKAAFYK